jgi:hypothetical protein
LNARRLLPAFASLALAPACSGLVANLAADSLSVNGTAFSSDDDPELIREAVPFGLKAIDSFLESSPKNSKLLLAGAAGYTQFAYGFVLDDADRLEPKDPDAARAQVARARKLLRRGYDYGFRGLEARHSGFLARFEKDRKAAVAELSKDDVPLAYWTAAALGARISISKDDMNAVGRLPEVEALAARALALDEAWDSGSLHELWISLDGGRSEALGGSLARAKAHFDRALQLSGGKRITPYVTWAEVVAVPAQDRKLFNQMLDKALSFDADEEPRFRLVNLIAQRRARRLKDRAGDLFLED